MKTSKLTGKALDWAVAKNEGWTNRRCGAPCDCLQHVNPRGQVDALPNYSGDGRVAVPLFEREGISVQRKHDGWWTGCKYDILDQPYHIVVGDTFLEAGLRCHVLNRLGAEVDIPEELL